MSSVCYPPRLESCYHAAYTMSTRSKAFTSVPYPGPGLPVRFANRLFRRLPFASCKRFYAIVLKKPLDEAISLNPVEGARWCLADSTDVEAMIAHPEGLSEKLYRNRVANGDSCYCLKRDGELLVYNWVRFTACCANCGRHDGFHFLPLQAGQAFTYDFYTYIKHRRQGLGGFLKAALLQDLQSKGVHEVLTIVEPGNESSLRVHMRLGYQPVTTAYGYSLFGVTRSFVGSARETVRLRQWMSALAESIHGGA